MLDLGEASSLNPARKTDLVIKGHNAKGFVNGFSRHNNAFPAGVS